MTWPEGNGRIVKFFVDQCGDRLRGNHAVTSIRDAKEEGLKHGGLKVRAFETSQRVTRDFLAEDVIFAAPQFLAPHLIANWSSSGRSVASFRYGGWVVANVFINQRPAEPVGEMCWDNVIVESRALGYVTATHQTGRDHGASVLTWYQPLLDEDPRVSRAELMRLTWDDWATVIVSDLQKAHPEIATVIDRIDVMRWGHAMIQPRVGFIFGDERAKASQSLGRVHFAGTDLSGVALMEEAFDRGIHAAEQCLS